MKTVVVTYLSDKEETQKYELLVSENKIAEAVHNLLSHGLEMFLNGGVLIIPEHRILSIWY